MTLVKRKDISWAWFNLLVTMLQLFGVLVINITLPQLNLHRNSFYYSRYLIFVGVLNGCRPKLSDLPLLKNRNDGFFWKKFCFKKILRNYKIFFNFFTSYSKSRIFKNSVVARRRNKEKNYFAWTASLLVWF